MKKILTIIGARPQFIKASAFSQSLATDRQLQEILVHTGQHHDVNMSDVFFDELNMPAPDYHLNIQGGTHGQMTGRMLEKIEAVLIDERPDMVVVYGDTNSTLAGALAASKLHIPIAHIEAGLRSFNMQMPEEVNRILTDRIADLLFVPSDVAAGHLASEGVAADKVIHCGDIMADVCRINSARAPHSDILRPRFNLDEKPFLLATIHRQENTDNPARLKAIIEALSLLGDEYQLIFPLHPRTANRLDEMGLALPSSPHFKAIEPIGYLDMIALVRDAALMITDSGGVQKEAFFVGTPCVTYRDETEWVELVDEGWNKLVDVRQPATEITAATKAQIGQKGSDKPIYGDGHAADIILGTIKDFLS